MNHNKSKTYFPLYGVRTSLTVLLYITKDQGCGMRAGAANHLKNAGCCLKRLDRLFVLIIFFGVMIFEITVLKHIWGIATLSRLYNTIILSIVCLYDTHSMLTDRFNKYVWLFYIIPGLYVFLGLLTNITINFINNFNLINYFGLLLPWALYLAIPSFLQKNSFDVETLWRYFYYFILTAVLLGLLDYVLIFFGLFSPDTITTPYGDFLSGRFSVLRLLEDGALLERFHACFSEPGTLAMFLLPAILYAYYEKKYIGLTVLTMGFYLTQSLGGIISALMVVPVLLFISLNKKRIPMVISLPILIIASSVMVMVCGNTIAERYEEKGVSRTTRADNFTTAINRLPSLLVNNLIGVELAEGSQSAIKDENYVGSNFTPVNALQMGGVSAFLGYIVVLMVSFVVAIMSLIRKNLSHSEAMIFCSIIAFFPFIVQRTTIWDCSIFALLFAPSIIHFLQSREAHVRHLRTPQAVHQ